METKTEQLDGKVKKKKMKTAVTAKFQNFQKLFEGRSLQISNPGTF